MPFGSVKKHYIIKSILIFTFLLAILLSQYLWDISSYLNQAHISQWLADAGSFAPLLYVLIMIIVAMSPFPNMPMDIAAGAFFGPLLGTVYSVTGTLGGAVISFSIARLLGRDLIERFLGGHINFCTVCSDRLLTKIVLFSRLLPIFSIDIISYGAGLTKMSLKRFSLATVLGLIPLAFIYNYFGSVLLIKKGVTITFGLLLVVLFFLIPRWIERYDLFSLRMIFEHHNRKPQ